MSIRRSTSSSCCWSVSGMSEPISGYDRYLLALGRLCATWAILDREINALLSAILKITDAQAACIATEMNDAAPRCRLLKTLSHTIPAPKEWKTALSDLTNVIMNDLSPSRNRYIHDQFGMSDENIVKFDRRVKLVKPQSFSEITLQFDQPEDVNADLVEHVAIKIISAFATVASARFDLEFWRDANCFPAQPQLSSERVKKILQVRLPPDD